MPSGLFRLSDTWMSALAVTRTVPVHPDQVLRLAEQANIRVLRRPGMPVRFHKDDVAKLAEGLVTRGPVPAKTGELASV